MDITRRIIAALLFCLGVIAILEARDVTPPATFSPSTLLLSSWDSYKQKFITPEGRVIDPGQNNITSSEGQSYALLRAVFLDDKPTFDHVLSWTQKNLKRPTDNLHGWRWGTKGKNSSGFLANGGENSASDAESDIAVALILANKKWNDPTYSQQATELLNDVWDKETMVVQGKRYLVAGNWVATTNKIVINPSYFSPYAWRIFAKFDQKHNWYSLIDPAYDLLFTVGYAPLDTTSGVGLPPDWVVLNKQSGIPEAPNITNYTTNYSFDAVRTPFRIALDYQWFGERRALTYLNGYFTKLQEYYLSNNKLVLFYTHSGTTSSQAEGPTMYATSLAFLMYSDPPLAEKIYTEKILGLYTTNNEVFKSEIPYYEQNWLWFGTALYTGYLKGIVRP